MKSLQDHRVIVVSCNILELTKREDLIKLQHYRDIGWYNDALLVQGVI